MYDLMLEAARKDDDASVIQGFDDLDHVVVEATKLFAGIATVKDETNHKLSGELASVQGQLCELRTAVEMQATEIARLSGELTAAHIRMTEFGSHLVIVVGQLRPGYAQGLV